MFCVWVDAGLREKLNKIMASDYFTMIPQMKAPVDVAVVMGKYNSQMQVAEVGSVPTQDGLQVAGAPVHYQHKVILYINGLYFGAIYLNSMQFQVFSCSY